MTKNFFNPQFFNPRVAKILSKFCKQSEQASIEFKMYNFEDLIEYEVQPKHLLFLPKGILSSGFRFGRINPEQKKRLVLHLKLTEEQLTTLVKLLGGTIKKVNPPPSPPTLGEILKI